MTTLADVKKRIGLKDEKQDEQLEEIIKKLWKPVVINVTYWSWTNTGKV